MKLLQMEEKWIQTSTLAMDIHTRFPTLKSVQDMRNEVIL